jgi:uncharacterized membrane protein YsdA (DUF1294 family)
VGNPYWRFGIVSLGAVIGLALALSAVINPLVAWLVSVNIGALALFRYDKSVAGTDHTRVPEAVLLFLVGVGGTGGAAIAMWLIRPRHKTQSGAFIARYLFILFLQFATTLFFHFRGRVG